MTDFNPGSILINTSNNKLYGVLVTTIQNNQSQANKIIVFRLDKNTHPIFSKFQLHPNVAKVGIINEHQYSNLKSALLKHYRTYNLTPTEKQMLSPLMNFAFPLGIPEYQPNVELPERDIQLMDLHSRIVPGARIFINTQHDSCYSQLDGKTLDVIDKSDNGVWTNLPNGEQDLGKLGNNMFFLFYKNKEIPTFGGISRITPILDNDDNGEMPKINEMLLEAFKKLKEQDTITTTMVYNGDNIRIMPKTSKVIFPEILKNMIYIPKSDSFTIDPSLVTKAMSQKLGNKLVVSRSGNSENSEINNINNIVQMIGSDNELFFSNDNENNNYKNTQIEKLGFGPDFGSESGSCYYNNNNINCQDGGGKGGKGGTGGIGDPKSNITDEDLNSIDVNYKKNVKYTEYDTKQSSLLESLKNIDDTDIIDEDYKDDDDDKNSDNNSNNNSNIIEYDEYELLDLISGIIPNMINKGQQNKFKKDEKDDKDTRDLEELKPSEETIIDSDIETEYDEDDVVNIINEDDV